MGKDSFVLYADTVKQIDMLTDEEAGRLFKSLFHYVAEGEEPRGLQPATMMAFCFIRSQIDRDSEKYEEVKRKRAEAGRAGGKQRAANQANASFAKQNQANQADTVPVPDPVPVSVSVPNAVGDEQDRTKRINFLRRMLNLYQNKTLCDPETQEQYQAELESLLQEDTE